MRATPDLVAHRGYALHYPENTGAAIHAALTAGAKYFECDVQLTADRVPILFHDQALDRVCGVPGRIHEVQFAELAPLSAYEPGRFGERFRGEPIASLEDIGCILKCNPEVAGFIEIKTESIEQFGVESVFDRVDAVLSRYARQVVLISYSREFIRHARGYAIGAIIDRWEDLAAIRSLHPGYVFCGSMACHPPASYGAKARS
ncbi:MAG: putative glycerophosphoryl diester phosphodiesterase 1 [Chromatiales bacterium USCg_Taylor]|nr:MAG: putative glycerophosphoryl diester phosphodiesterase 1 [Chromatiales bacterium USCg_Taylor]